jgi:hypothetical protein
MKRMKIDLLALNNSNRDLLTEDNNQVIKYDLIVYCFSNIGKIVPIGE